MERELSCPTCQQIFAAPVMLECTHHVCSSHVPELSERGNICCPACGEATPVQGQLRVDRALQLVSDIYRDRQQVPVQNGSGPSPPPLCGFCEEQPGTRRCLQCDGVLCDVCEQSSHSKGFFRNHNVLNLNEAHASQTDAEFASRMVCDEHSGEKLAFYCLACRKPVCSHCLILGDHKGHQQTPIDQAFETGKDTLRAWVEKLRQRISCTNGFHTELEATEQDIHCNSEAQRDLVNREMDHLREIIETKRCQLLAKCAIEEKNKRSHLQAQMERADKAGLSAGGLVSRAEDLLGLSNEHAFLSVVLPLIQDMKKCATEPLDLGVKVTCSFRSLNADAQAHCLGDLDLGPPRMKAAPMQPHRPGHSTQSLKTVSTGVTHPGAYGGCPSMHATVAYLPVSTPPPLNGAPVPGSQPAFLSTPPLVPSAAGAPPATVTAGQLLFRSGRGGTARLGPGRE